MAARIEAIMLRYSKKYTPLISLNPLAFSMSIKFCPLFNCKRLMQVDIALILYLLVTLEEIL